MGIILFDEIQKDFGIGMVHVKTLESFFLCQVFEKGLCTVSPYITLAEHGECDAVVQAAEFLHLRVAARLLPGAFCAVISVGFVWRTRRRPRCLPYWGVLCAAA